jgi:hypothetical protein
MPDYSDISDQGDEHTYNVRLADKQGSHHSAINCIRCNGAGRREVAYIRGDLFRNLRMES